MAFLEEIKAFERVARTGSLSAAGRELRIATAGVSKRITDLEARLGADLFHRSTRGMHLTEEGHVLLDRADHVLDDVQQIEGLFTFDHSSAISGTLRVTAPSRVGARFVAPALPILTQRHPDLNIEVSLTNDLVDLISAGMDVAIRMSMAHDLRYHVIRIGTNQRVLCAAPGYLERRGIPRTPEDLAHHDCIVRGPSETWRFEKGGEQIEMRIPGRIRCLHGDEVHEFVRMGGGIALKSAWDIQTCLKSGAMVRVLPDYELMDNTFFTAVLPSRSYIPPKVRVFLDALRDVMSNPTHPETPRVELLAAE